MVAKSYINCRQLGEPYIVGGRKYVKIDYKGSPKQVRWYSEAEYIKFYGEAAMEERKQFKTQKEVLGFKNDYVWIFKGDTYSVKEYFKANGGHYTRWWGWALSELPEDLPDGIEPIKLMWSAVGKEDGTLISEDGVKEAIDALIYAESDSEYVGEIGDNVDIMITVTKSMVFDSYYGTSTMHIMNDDFGNTYVWTTASKCWEEGSEHHIKGKIKDHKAFKGVKQTILTRCREVKD